MSAAVARRVLLGAAGACGLLGHLVLTASPAAAHSVGGGSLPAPAWLLGYIGAFAVVLTAATLHTAWPSARAVAPPAAIDDAAGSDGPWVGQAIGLALLAAMLVAAVEGPDTGAANVAPVAVLVMWWVGLPILCLLAGDVMRVVNPFAAVVRASDRLRRPKEGDRPAAPPWTAAAFLAAFAWFLLCYHRPGSPRGLGAFLAAYALAAVLGGLRWGRAWLQEGEGFAGLSAAVATLAPLPRRRALPAGVLPLVVVWLGSTGFDALSSTELWTDVRGTSAGWERTLLDSVGLIWMIAVVAAVALVVLRVAESRQPDLPRNALTVAVAAALVPLALGWFVAHDLTFLLFEGQNFYALASDPLGRGWDLFGTIGYTIDYGLVQGEWVRWVQLAALLVGHVAAVVLAHDAALARVSRRLALRTTWSVAAASAASIVVASLLVMG
ncbi:MAG: hypothetical protein Q8K58_09515 [Acidimicrobiales bacterium]|nr:hypothetical protein [Acidimicrobiales bacterium]